MSKIMFIGDVHLNNKAPASRKEEPEEYRDLILSKLDYCFNYSVGHDIQNVIIEGDIFNSSKDTDPSYVNKFYSLLKSYSDKINIYSIIGNHDLYYNNYNDFNKTTLFQCFITGMLKPLDEIHIGPVTVKGIDYSKDFVAVSNLKQKGDYNIMVAHCFYENERFGGTGNDNLTDEKCNNLGYTAYVLGHDHTPYDKVVKKDYVVIRTGALMRGTSKTCNLYRKVNVAVFDISTFTWSEVEVPTKPGKEVFNEKVVISKDIDLNLEKLLENFSASKNVDVYSIIESHREQGQKILKEKYNSVESLIIEYLEAAGLYKQLDETNN